VLGRSQSGFVKLAMQNRLHAFFVGSLNTQEVSVAVQSIRTPVQVGNIASDHLLVAAREMPLGKMNGVRELDHLAQEIRAHAKALDNTRHLFASRSRAPEVIRGSGIAGCFSVFNDSDLCRGFCGLNNLVGC
jgi:hypothetical protein